MFSDVEPNYNQLVNALGFSGDTAKLRKRLKHIPDQRAKYTNENKSPFHPLDEINQRKDCVRHKPRKCVYNFCHSEEVALVDKLSYRVLTVLEDGEDKKKDHPMRVRNEIGLEARHQAFKYSRVYAKFKVLNPDDNISKEVFCIST